MDVTHPFVESMTGTLVRYIWSETNYRIVDGDIAMTLQPVCEKKGLATSIPIDKDDYTQMISVAVNNFANSLKNEGNATAIKLDTAKEGDHVFIYYRLYQ